MRYVAIYVAGLLVLAAGTALAVQSGLTWAPGAMGGVAVVAVGVSVMLAKRSRQLKTRSGAKDSVESVRDVGVRAAVFLDLIVAIALTLMVSVLWPNVSGALVSLVLLAVLLVDYWARAFWAARR